MKQVFYFLILFATRLVAQSYDFSAATAQLQSNLGVYGNRVVVIAEQRELGEIFRFEAGAITQDSKIGIASCTKCRGLPPEVVLGRRWSHGNLAGPQRLDSTALGVESVSRIGRATSGRPAVLSSGKERRSPNRRGQWKADEMNDVLSIAQTLTMAIRRSPLLG